MDEYLEIDENSKTEDFMLELQDALAPANTVQIINLIQNQKEAWKEKIKEILSNSKCSQQEFANRCGVSRVSVNKWCAGSLPKNRETMITIGLAAGLDEEEMNILLQKYGRYQKLYVKNLEDCICAFVIKNYSVAERVSKYCEIKERIKLRFESTEKKNENRESTTVLEKKLSKVSGEGALEQFVVQNSQAFAAAYHKLYIALRKKTEQLMADAKSTSIDGLKLLYGWSSSMVQSIYAVFQKKWYPTRKRLIIICLWLGLTQDETDEMLMLAGMQPLYSKNPIDAAIISALAAEAYAVSHGKKSSTTELIERVVDFLAVIDLPEAESFVEELSGE